MRSMVGAGNSSNESEFRLGAAMTQRSNQRWWGPGGGKSPLGTEPGMRAPASTTARQHNLTESQLPWASFSPRRKSDSPALVGELLVTKSNPSFDG